MDAVLYGQLYNDAMSGMDSLFDDMKDSMKNFNKKNYSNVFEEMQRKYGKVMICIEQVYNEEGKDPQNWVNKLAERFVSHAQELISAKKWKFQRENMTIDCNMFLVSYVFPLILEYDGNMAEPLAEAIRDQWNEAFDTQLECGNFERISNGFSNSIFGIPMGKR